MTISTLNSQFSGHPCDNNLRSMLTILRSATRRQSPFSIRHFHIPTWRQSLFSILHSQNVYMKKVSIVNSTFSDYPHQDSLYSQFTFIIALAHRPSLFSIRHSQIVHMEKVSILNSPFSSSLHEDSIHSQFTIFRLRTWRQHPFSDY